VTVPTALSNLVTVAENGLSLSINGSTRKEGDAAVHDIVFGAYGPVGTLLTDGSVTFKLTITAPDATTTTTTGTTTAAKGPVGQGPSAKGTVNQLSSIVSVGASAVASVQAATGPKPPRISGGAKPGKPSTGSKPAGGRGGSSQGGQGANSIDGSASGPGGAEGGSSTSGGDSTAGGDSAGGDGADSFDEGDSTSPEFTGVDFGL
jgi:hypothetical protein